jgi:ribosomal protein S18 acetylase RimI-like enzyme
MAIEIRHFQPADAAVVAALNRAWLVEYGLLEPPDEVFLSDPGGKIFGAGGAIFVAVRGNEVVGTSSMLPVAPGVIELVKLGVAADAQGQGVGRRLIEACLDFARQQGATRVTLISNSKLEAALRLYERFGFQRLPLPADQPYATADIYMELSLSA